MAAKGGISAVRDRANQKGPHAIAQIIPGRVPDLKPLVPLDAPRQKLWDEVIAAFDGTDHLRASDSGLVQAYVDSISNYVRLRHQVEILHDTGLTPNGLKTLYGALGDQSRLVGMLSRELGFGPMARNRLGGFVPDPQNNAIESFTSVRPGRTTR